MQATRPQAEHETMTPTADNRRTLAPLPWYHRRDLTLLATFSTLSFVSTTSLWLFITFKLISFRWSKFREQRQQKRRGREQQRHVEMRDPDFSLGLEQLQEHMEGRTALEQLQEMDRMRLEHDRQQAQPLSSTASDDQAQDGREQDDKADWNPFPMLVYNLLLADMQVAGGYCLSLHWLSVDGIYAPSSVCWAQGWFCSVGNLAASLFLSAISVTTFCTIVLGYRPSRKTLYMVVACMWLMAYSIHTAGVITSLRSRPVLEMGESYFMRADVWCWVSSEFSNWRLWAHYFWIMTSVSLTLCLYSVVFLTLWRQKRSCRHLPDPAGHQGGCPRRSGYHPAFLVYPFIYLVCTASLAVGRVYTIAGHRLGMSFFAFAGCMMGLHGFFNSALWTTTILFSAPDDMRATGLDKFSFLRTPERSYGHTVVISGPVSQGYAGTYRRAGGERRERREWWWWRFGGQRGWGKPYVGTHESLNRDLMRICSEPQPVDDGSHIHLNVVTQVVVEDANKEGRP